MVVKKCAKVAKIFCCQICDYTTSHKYHYDKHLTTAKHKMVVNGSEKWQKEQEHDCICWKKYKHISGYYRHKKVCSVVETSYNSENIEGLTDKQLIMKLLQENTEMRKALVETCNKSQPSTINSNNNSNNKTFNLQFFLNETCKDALNINDFVSSIQLQLTDLETTGRIGYVEGISKIVIQNLNNMEQYRRPVHCSDIKREIMYIKDNDEWTKEDTSKPLLTRAIKIIANENIKKISEWKQMNPDCTNSDSNKNNVYLNIVSNAMSGSSQEETNKNIGKIISNIVKETQIEK
jgi:hypothetical protein